MALDLKVFQFIHGFAGVSGVLDFFGIFFAEYLPYVFGIALLFFILKRRGAREKLFAFLYLVFTGIISYYVATPIVKFIFPRERPFEFLKILPLIPAGGSSFPSGNAAFFFAVAFVLFTMNRKWGIWFLLFAILNGVAQVFVGVHYPLDIVGGAVVGFITYLIFKFSFFHNNESRTFKESEDVREFDQSVTNE